MKNLENWNELKTLPIKVYLNVSENCQTPKQFVNLTHYDMTANWNVYIYIYIHTYIYICISSKVQIFLSSIQV